MDIHTAAIMSTNSASQWLYLNAEQRSTCTLVDVDDSLLTIVVSGRKDRFTMELQGYRDKTVNSFSRCCDAIATSIELT